MEFNDEYFMKQALRQAKLAAEAGEVPVGAVVVWDNKIIGRGYNQVELLQDTTAHAEMIAITAATNSIGAKYLQEATLYVTVEPCLMCAGAIYWAKVGKIVYGTPDPKNGYRKSTGSNNPFHPKATLITGVMADECAELMKSFFAERRRF